MLNGFYWEINETQLTMMFEALSRMMRNFNLNQFQIRHGATKVSCSVVSDKLCHHRLKKKKRKEKNK